MHTHNICTQKLDILRLSIYERNARKRSKPTRLAELIRPRWRVLFFPYRWTMNTNISLITRYYCFSICKKKNNHRIVVSTWTKTKPNQSEPIWSDREGKQSNNNIDEKKHRTTNSNNISSNFTLWLHSNIGILSRAIPFNRQLLVFALVMVGK